MDLTRLIETIQESLGRSLPSIGGALLILLGGWLVALLVRAAARRALGAVALDRRVEASTGSAIGLERGISLVLYYVVLLLVLVGFFNALQLQQVSGSVQTLVDQIFAFTPRLIGGGVLLLVAWVLATIVRSIAGRALASTRLDERLSAEAGMAPIGESLANVLYWLVILLLLPAVLGALELQGLLSPVEGMVDELLAMLPNVLAAAIIGGIGWLVARILRDLVANLLAAAGADRIGERSGLQGTLGFSRLVGLVVYVFVLVPALIAALDALAIQAISEPATHMLNVFMAAIPDVFAAGLILAVAWLVSRFVADLTGSLLGGAGFDRLPERLGLGDLAPEGTTPSQLVGRLVVFFVMLFAASEAAARLGFDQVSGLVAVLIAFGGQVVLGLVIIAVGFWISGIADGAVRRVGDSAFAAGVARFGILGVVIAMGLRAMGLADDIVNLAFGLTLGAIAVAFALAFGLGGREAAGRQMEHWLGRLRGE